MADGGATGRDLTSTPRVHIATRWNAFGRLGVTTVRWIAQVWLLRLLAVEDFGHMAIAASVTTLLLHLTESGIGQAVVQRRTLDSRYLSSVFWLNITLGLSLSALVWLASTVTASLIGSNTLTALLPFLTISFAVLSTAVVPRALLVRDLAFNRVSAALLAEASVYSVVTIWLAFQGAGIWALAIGTVAGSVTNAVATWTLSRWRPTATIRIVDLREVWAFAASLVGARVANHIFLEADRIVIYGFLGAEATGYYYAALQLVIFPIATLAQVLAGVLMPTLARFQTDLAQLRETYLRAMAGLVLVVAPVVFGILAVLEPIISGFLSDAASGGDKWRPALAPALIVGGAAFVRALFIANSSVFVALGATRLMLRWTVALGSTLILGYTVGAMTFGLVGVALGYTIAHLLLAPFIFGTSFRLMALPARSALRAMLPATALAAVMAGVVVVSLSIIGSAGASDRVRAVAGVSVGVIAFGVAVVSVRPPGLDDLLRLTGLRRA